MAACMPGVTKGRSAREHFLLDYSLGARPYRITQWDLLRAGPGPAKGARSDPTHRGQPVRWAVMTVEKDNIQFSSLFRPSEVICRTEETDRDRLVMNMVELLARRNSIRNIEDAYKAVLEREKDFPTIVAPGMAMPHARLEDIPEIAVAVATCRQGIVYDPRRPDDLVKLLVLTLAPKASPGLYLQAIGCVAAICRDPSTPEIVASLPTADQVWSFFDQGGTGRTESVKDAGK